MRGILRVNIPVNASCFVRIFKKSCCGYFERIGIWKLQEHIAKQGAMRRNKFFMKSVDNLENRVHNKQVMINTAMNLNQGRMC